jgi:hypothetical protein
MSAYLDAIVTVNIPKDFTVEINNGEIFKSLIDVGTDVKIRKIIALDFGGGLFEAPTASLTIFERKDIESPLKDFGGLWSISIGSQLVFKGYAETPTKESYWGGVVWNITLKSVLSAWDILFTETTFGITGSGADHIVANTTEYLQYLIDTVGSLSDIPFYGTLPENSIPFEDLYIDCLSITNTTYLTEIQRVCQTLGFILFADPIGTIRIIDALNPPENVIFTSSYHAGHLLSYTDTKGLATIPATVLAADDIAGIGKAYGHIPSAGITADNLNFDLTGLNNISFAVTVGMKPEAIPLIAKQVFDVARKTSQVITFDYAGIFEAQWILGYQVSWQEEVPAGVPYTIKSYRTSISVNSVITTTSAYLS